MNNNFSICYAIKDTVESESTFLKGSVHTPETIAALKHINDLPMSIAELLCTREEAIRTRLDSIFHGRIIEFIKTPSDIIRLPYTFKVVFLNTPLPDDHIIQKDIFYVSLRQDICAKNLPYFETLSIESLREFYFAHIRNKEHIYTDLPDTFSPALPVDPHVTINDTIFTHGNIATLKSIGIHPGLSVEDTIKLSSNVENTRRSIDLVNEVKSKISQHYPSTICMPSVDYLITDFSIDLEYSINAKRYTKHALIRADISDAALMAESITYAKSQTNIDQTHANRFTQHYKKEVYFSSLINYLYAAPTLAAEIKLRVSNNLVFPTLSDMGLNIRNQNTSKLHKLAARFSKHVISTSDGLLDYISSDCNKHIKIISNLPLEWTNLNGLPLMLRHNTSRVFSTPGFIKEKILTNNHEIKLTINDFSKILVISSFGPDDQIRQHMQQEIEKTMRIFDSEEFPKLIQEAVKNGAYVPDFKPEIVFRSISNKAELITALSEYRYALVIFDMHGGHDSDSHGYLKLADGKLYPQELAGAAQIPPIVILSACDTSPADRNHFNVANAFLCAGAVSVLASTYPILSKDAAVYISRLYKRIRLYLPERILHKQHSLRWSDFITGANRRIYFSYFMRHIYKKYKIEKSIIEDIGNKTNYILEAYPDSFLSKIIYLFEAHTSLNNQVILDELNMHFTFAECMNYVQIGRPEKILIHAEDISHLGE